MGISNRKRRNFLRSKYLLFFFSCSLFGFEKLDSKYWIKYGASELKPKAVEYFSLSCPKCLEFFKKEFPSIKKSYIDSGSLEWVFHPDPADLLTLQMMVCLDALPENQKIIFFETLMENLMKFKKKGKEVQLMKTIMEALGKPQNQLEDLDFLKNTEAFENAFSFVKQEDAITVIPSIEINGIFYEKTPTLSLIQQLIIPNK